MPETTTHSGFDGTISYTAEPLPADTNLATARTIERMAQYVREDASSDLVRSALDQAVTPLMRTNRGVTLALIFGWVRSRVKFVPDAASAALMTAAPAAPHDIELLIRPVDLLRMSRPVGDCDDFSMLTAALLTAARIPCRFVTIAANSESDDWSHVYVEAELEDGSPIALDTSHGSYPGWEYATPTRRQTWPVDKQEGLGSMFPGMTAAATPGTTGRIIENAIGTGMDILKNRYGTAPLSQYTQRADGSFTHQQYQPGVGLSLPFGPNSSVGGSTWLLLAAAAVAVVFVLKK